MSGTTQDETTNHLTVKINTSMTIRHIRHYRVYTQTIT